MAWHRLVRSLECSVLLAVLMVSSLASWLNVLIVFMVIVSSLVFSLVIAQSCHLRFTDRSRSVHPWSHTSESDISGLHWSGLLTRPTIQLFRPRCSGSSSRCHSLKQLTRLARYRQLSYSLVVQTRSSTASTQGSRHDCTLTPLWSLSSPASADGTAWTATVGLFPSTACSRTPRQHRPRSAGPRTQPR